ncbi:glycerate kinase [Agreia sp. Leaf283]|nr:glycerate kinase [Agreia sp. Leaf283]
MSRVVMAPDSFKGSSSADAVARAIAGGWARARPDDDLVLLPLADGGEGTIDAVAAAVPGSQRMPVRVTGPDDAVVDAEWLLLPDGTGVVELANTSGLPLLAGLRPLDAHTRGFGQAVRAALDHGVGRLVLAIGGSSSTDGGAGVLSELGARFLDAEGSPIADGNRGLHDLVEAELSGLRPLPPGGVTVLCDVTNPLLGERGSARVFGPQKGASPDLVDELERGLAALASALPAVPADLPGVGAAGGVGFGLVAWGAVLVSGSDEIALLSGLDAAISAADVVVTGEGSFDEQSADGKVASRVLSAARAASTVPMLVAGRIAAPSDDFAAVVSLTDLAGSRERSLAHPLVYAEQAGAVLAVDFSRRG